MKWSEPCATTLAAVSCDRRGVSLMARPDVRRHTLSVTMTHLARTCPSWAWSVRDGARPFQASSIRARALPLRLRRIQYSYLLAQ
jgi:hypothetical protein